MSKLNWQTVTDEGGMGGRKLVRSGLPAGMESEMYIDDEVHVVGEKISEQKKHEEIVANPEPDGCWHQFLGGVRDLWQTRWTENTADNMDFHVSTTLRELFTYLIFLAVANIVVFGMVSSNTYYFSRVMIGLFSQSSIDGSSTTTFEGMSTMTDVWKYLRFGFQDAIFWSEYYNGDVKDMTEHQFLFHENKLLGVPRLRQVRVRNDSCTVFDVFKQEIPECWDAYGLKNEDDRHFGPENTTYSAPEAWHYNHHLIRTDTKEHSGHMGIYSSGGFVQDLSMNKTETKLIIEDLFNNLWLDQGSRALFIDLQAYNANINLFCVIQLVIEFPPTGGVWTLTSFRTVKLLRYVTLMDHFVAGMEALFLLFCIYYTIEEVMEIKKRGFSYFKNVWNCLDIMIVGIGYFCIGFNVYRWMEVTKALDVLFENPSAYVNFDKISSWQITFQNGQAWMVFFALVKLFKYISFNKTMTQLQNTLSGCAKDLVGFLLMFAIFFVAFTQLGYLIFGTQVEGFKTFSAAVYTLLRIILGDFDFKVLEATDRLIGPIYFIAYVFFIFFVLVNMFLAIINDTYGEVKAGLENQKSEFELGQFMKRHYGAVFDRLRRKKNKINAKLAALKSADADNDNVISLAEWRDNMTKRGVEASEIERVFKKYDKDGDQMLDKAEQDAMLEELCQADEEVDEDLAAAQEDAEEEARLQRRRQKREVNAWVSEDELDGLISRVDRMEQSLGNLVVKIDVVFNKIANIEKAKITRRQIMRNMLERMQSQSKTLPEVEEPEYYEEYDESEEESEEEEEEISDEFGDSPPVAARSARPKTKPRTAAPVPAPEPEIPMLIPSEEPAKPPSAKPATAKPPSAKPASAKPPSAKPHSRPVTAEKFDDMMKPASAKQEGPKAASAKKPEPAPAEDEFVEDEMELNLAKPKSSKKSAKADKPASSKPAKPESAKPESAKKKSAKKSSKPDDQDLWDDF